jgi:hypothetical protein
MKGILGVFCLLAFVGLIVSFWWVILTVAVVGMLIGMAHQSHHDLTRKAAPVPSN